MDYTVIQPNNELRACSRQQLKGVWLSAALAFLVYTLILSGPFVISYYIDIFMSLSEIWDGSSWDLGGYGGYGDYGEDGIISPVTMILYLGIFVVNGAFMLGFAGYFLKRIRGEEIALKNIFDGFKRFGTAFLLSFFTFLFVMLWSLLLFIPGIIKALSYSMAVYILNDNPGMSSLEAIKKSKIMMKGYKGKLFLLELSFIGWIMLGALSFGIGLLWVYPYMYISIANFYENLKHTQEKALVHDTPAPAAEETLTQNE